jgi:hypothetical protein
MKPKLACAACGAAKVVRATTFMVGYGKHAGEYSICKKCWEDGPNDEAWNDKITARIVRRARRTREPQTSQAR